MNINYPYWAGRFSGFLSAMKYHELPDDLQTQIDKLLAEWEELHAKEMSRVLNGKEK